MKTCTKKAKKKKKTLKLRYIMENKKINRLLLTQIHF